MLGHRCSAPGHAMRHLSGRLLIACLFFTFALLLSPSYSWALGIEAGDDVVTLKASIFQQYDSNLFRLPDQANVQQHPGGQQTSDTVRVTQIGLKLDKRYSLQRLQLEASVSDLGYRHFDFLDHRTRNYNAAWHWAITSRLNGQLAVERSQSLINYADYTGSYERANVRTNETRRFNLAAELASSWQLVASARRTRQYNTLFFDTDGNHVLDEVETGLRYLSASASQISLTSQRGKGRYTDREPRPNSLTDNRFRQQRLKLDMNWQFSPRSQLSLDVGPLKRQHEHFAQRDYSGTIGSLQFVHALTDQLQLRLRGSRELNSYQTPYASWYVGRSVSLGPNWAISPRLNLGLQWQHTRRDYQGSPLPGLLARTDRLETRQLHLLWSPQDSLMFNASLGEEKRHSNLDNMNYRSHTVSLSGNLGF